MISVSCPTAGVTTPAMEGAPDGDLSLCLDLGDDDTVSFAACTGDVNQRFTNIVGAQISAVAPSAFAIMGREDTEFAGMCMTAQDDGSVTLMDCNEVLALGESAGGEVNKSALWRYPELVVQSAGGMASATTATLSLASVAAGAAAPMA